MAVKAVTGNNVQGNVPAYYRKTAFALFQIEC